MIRDLVRSECPNRRDHGDWREFRLVLQACGSSLAVCKALEADASISFTVYQTVMRRFRAQSGRRLNRRSSSFQTGSRLIDCMRSSLMHIANRWHR